jgi:hypothetical protein
MIKDVLKITHRAFMAIMHDSLVITERTLPVKFHRCKGTAQISRNRCCFAASIFSMILILFQMIWYVEGILETFSFTNFAKSSKVRSKASPGHTAVHAQGRAGSRAKIWTAPTCRRFVKR